MQQVSPDNLTRQLRKFTCDIGIRLAGTPGEKQAAAYTAAEFRRAGADVITETFPVRSRQVTEESLRVKIAGRWQTFPCSLFSSTPGTNGRTVEAPLVFHEAPAEWERADLSRLTGKAVVHLGCHIESRAAYKRLIDAKPAFLLFVDVRYPGTAALADGMFPAYTRAVGAVSTVNVAFMDAWRWQVEGATAARLRVVGGMRPGRSQNVIAELLGTDADAGILFLGAHHDTQAGSVGADDNGVGVAGLLELARVLAPLPRRRTIRLISFGAEEQLSVGSAEYVRKHRRDVERRGRLMFNLDSFGSHLGWYELTCNGPSALERHTRTVLERGGVHARIVRDIVPYADHFPFVAAGIPGIWLGRVNCTAGRFFHHRPDDDLTRISMPRMATTLDAVAALIAELAQAPRLPFPARIPPRQALQVSAFWRDLFGGWSGRE